MRDASGADPEQLDRLAQQFDELAAELGRRRGSLNLWIEGDRFWRGPRAEEFRHEWATQFSPQLGNAVDFLQRHVTQLHDNANQQRVASGEQPKDYGGGFLDKLWGTVEHDVQGGWNAASTFVKDLGGSKAFAEVIGVAQIVSTVAAFLPPPADFVSVGAAGLVMAGHLAQMANKGEFKPGEFAADAAGVFGGGAVAVLNREAKALNAVARAEFATADSATRAQILVGRELGLHTITTQIHDVRIGQSVGYAAGTVESVGEDLGEHHYVDAVTDVVTGAAKVIDPGAAVPDAIKDSERLITGAPGERVAHLGGYDE